MHLQAIRLAVLKISLAVAAVSAAAVASPAPLAQEGAPQDPKPAEGASIEDVDQRLRVLERKAELEKEAQAEKEKNSAKVSAGKDGFILESADGRFKLRIRGYIQLDGRFFDHDEERPTVDTFVVRRARPILEGTVYRIFDFRIMPDFGNGQTVLQDAYLDARFSPFASVRAGKFKPPVGLERLQSATDLLFIERALPTNLVPNRDVGIQLFGEAASGILTYQAGVFNGVPDGGNGDVDTTRGKEGAGRVFVLPFKTTKSRPVQNLGVGVSGTYGLNEGTTGSTGLAGYRTAGQQTFFAYRSNGTIAGTAIADGRRTRVSPQLYWYAGRFGLLAESVTSRQELVRDGAPAELTNRAWQASASFMLTDDSTSFRTISPREPFDPPNKGIGAFEIAARAGALRVDEDAFPLYADPSASAEVARECAGAFNWYLNRNLRVMVDYSWTRFRGGAADGEDREDERVVLTRFQIAF